MSKRGRPKTVKLVKNRIHSIALTETNERIFRMLSQKKGHVKWFSEFVNECMGRCYFGRDLKEKLLSEDMYRLDQEIRLKEADLRFKAEELRLHRETMEKLVIIEKNAKS